MAEKDSNSYGGPSNTVQSGQASLSPPQLLGKGPTPPVPCRDNDARQGDLSAPMPLKGGSKGD